LKGQKKIRVCLCGRVVPTQARGKRLGRKKVLNVGATTITIIRQKTIGE